MLAELVGKLKEKLDPKRVAATSAGEKHQSGELRPNLDGLTVGVDLGDQWSHYCILGLEGETLAANCICGYRNRRNGRTTPGPSRRSGTVLTANWEKQGVKVRVGMEASGHARWFEGLLGDLQFELWIGNAAEIRTKRVRKQKTDRQDAQLLLRLMIEDRFPRIGIADTENRDLRQLLWHRHRLVQMRTRVMISCMWCR